MKGVNQALVYRHKVQDADKIKYGLTDKIKYGIRVFIALVWNVEQCKILNLMKSLLINQ